jgi:hypothetical protein
VIQTTYQVTVSGNTFTYTTGDSTDPNGTNTGHIASQLAAAINGVAGFTAVTNGNLVRITRADEVPFTFDASDTWGGQAMHIFCTQVNRYEELPRRFVEGPIIEIKGDPNSSSSSWYVTWKKDDSNSDGVWVETVKPYIQFALSPSNMPHELVRNADGTWTFRRSTWGERNVGDEESNPDPSFVGKTINDVVFHRNRLGILADESLVMSEAGGFFNFFATTGRAVLDSDPIDVSASGTKVTLLRHAIPYDRTLLILSDKQQFQLSNNDTLTPKNARLEPTSAFDMSSACRPAPMGKNCFLATERGAYTGVREYYVDANAAVSDAVDVSSHVPSFIPYRAFKMCAVPAQDMLLVLSLAQRNAIWVYNSLWQGEEKLQSAWHKWTFQENDVVLSVDSFGTDLALVISRPDGVYLEWMRVEDRPYSPVNFQICLDRWIGYGTCLYDSSVKKSFWTLPYPCTDPMQIVVVTKENEIGQVLDLEQVSEYVVAVKGDYRNQTVVIGVRFTQTVEYSKFYVADKKGAILDGRFMLRDMKVALAETGYCKARVLRGHGDVDEYVFPGKHLGGPRLILGTRPIITGDFNFPLMGEADDIRVQIVNDSALSSVIQNAEVTGAFAMQGRRL